MRQGLTSHYFHVYNRDGHQPNSRGLYTHYKDSLLKVGPDHPQYKEWIDPGIDEETISSWYKLRMDPGT